MYLEEGPKRFSAYSIRFWHKYILCLYLIKDIERILIPRFFRTLFEGGVSEVYFLLKQPKEIFHSPTVSLECEQGSLITCFGKPSHIKVSKSKINFILLKIILFFSDLYRRTFYHWIYIWWSNAYKILAFLYKTTSRINSTKCHCHTGIYWNFVLI